MKIRGNRVLVYLLNEQEQTTSGGIILPKNSKDDVDALVGEIVEIGLGDEVSDLHDKRGSKVLFPSYAGTKYNLLDKHYVILNSSDVLAVLEEEDTENDFEE